MCVLAQHTVRQLVHLGLADQSSARREQPLEGRSGAVGRAMRSPPVRAPRAGNAPGNVEDVLRREHQTGQRPDGSSVHRTRASDKNAPTDHLGQRR